MPPTLPNDPPHSPLDSPLPASIVALDLEISLQTGQLLAAGWVWDGKERSVGAEGLPEVLNLLQAAQQTETLLIGHNIRRFDLPQLWQLSCQQAAKELSPEAHERWPELFGGAVLDTLELSSLVWPGKPSHRLDKLYRQQSPVNDPVHDAKESLELLQEATAELAAHPWRPALTYWLRLLPPSPLRKLLMGAKPSYAAAASDFHAALREQHFADKDIQRLWVYLAGLSEGEQENLGALVALHWLMHRDQPSHRRPAWASEHYPSFGEAETALLGEPDYSEAALRRELQSIYGPHYDFKPGQLELIQATLRGEVVPLGLLPTGGGKSLTFQFPALLLSRRERALSVVMSPLVALMADQVLSLQANLPQYAERVAYLSGTQTPDEQRQLLEGVWEGRIDVLYLSPERLRNPGVQRLLRHRCPALWVLDEAHTLSQWGMDFRPDFLRVAGHIADVHKDKKPPLLTLLTATATARVLDDLQEHLLTPLAPLLGRPLLRLPTQQPSPWRSNIDTQIIAMPPEERLSATRAELLTSAGQGRVSIVYVRSRKRAQEYAQTLGEDGELRTAYFHARMPGTDKAEVLRQFKAGELDVVVATSAFGMGIDRPGIHTVIHIGPPNTAESYLQEIGRVARQAGEQGRAILYWDESDFVWTLRQDAEVRIGNDSLYKCWTEAKKCLSLPFDQRWLSSQNFERPLGMMGEDLLTQTRVALRALEAYGLLTEGQQQPAELLLTMRRPTDETQVLGQEAQRLKSWVSRTQGWQVGKELALNMMQTSLLSALSPQSLLLAARQLVLAGEASWSYRVTIRFRAKRRTRLELVRVSLRTLFNHWQDHDPDLNFIHGEEVQADLSSRNKAASWELARLGLRVLGLAHARKNGAHWSLTPQETAQPLSEWRALTEQRLGEINRIWTELLSREDLASDTLTLNISELEALNVQTRPSSQADLNNTTPDFGPLEALLALEGLGSIDLARGDEDTPHIFRLERGTQSNYSKPKVYAPLKSHYADRTRRIHVMRLLAQQPDQAARQKFIEDYFALPLDEFCQRYYPENPDELTVAQLPGTRERILAGLNEVQRQVVQDSTSRALLVLAGPGSGKTRTIVHRAAALLALEAVPPEQILILAYNRTAVTEVRSRLGALLAPLGLSYRPQVLTFHGLARHLTNQRATDAKTPPSTAHPEGQPISNPDQQNQWLLAQLSQHLHDHDVAYRYILVDEYQDIDEQKYEIIRQLTGFSAAETSPNSDANHQVTDQPNDEADEDQAEQQSYLVAVGDDDQNIYGFMGANIRYIQQFRADYQITQQAELYLTDNYRSSPEIVAFNNAFMAAALPQSERLKGPEQAIVSRVTEPGQVGFCYYHHPYDAAYTTAAKIYYLHQSGMPLHDMAVLAPTWGDLHLVQHALRERQLDSQYFDTSDDLRPADGLLGRHLLRQLDAAPSMLCAEPLATLAQLCTPYSPQDGSYPALQAALHGLTDTTYEIMSMRLRGAKPLRRGAVALSTFHSAKGSEFEQVFVLDTGKDQRHPDPTRRADSTRALYVALTRARRRLFVLSSHPSGQPAPHPAGHPVFTATWLSQHLPQATIPTAPRPKLWPKTIRYTLQLEPRDLMLSAAQVISEAGRAGIDHYAQQWQELRLQGRAIKTQRGQTVAVLSNRQMKDLEALQQRGGTVRSVHAQQIFFMQRDDEWYGNNYTGPLQGHFVVLPALEIEAPLAAPKSSHH